MKTRKFLVAAAALVMALPAAAQDASTMFLNAQGTDQHLAKDTLIGAKVYGKDGTIIGDIEDLILSDGNTVVGVIIGTGGFLGLAEKRVGVDLNALSSSDKGGTAIISLPVTHADLVATPAYQRALPKKSLLERVQEKAQELKDKTTDTSKDAYEKAKPAIEDAKEKAKDAYEKAKPAIEDAKEKAKEVYENAKEKVQDAVSGNKPAEPATTPVPEATPAPAPEAAPAPAPEAAAPAPEATPAPAPATPAPTTPEATPAPTPDQTPAPEAAPAPGPAPGSDTSVPPPATETPAEPPAQQ